MKAFISWSGGKDCMYALHYFLKNEEHKVACLLNMCDTAERKSRSHGLGTKLLAKQADALGIKLMQEPITDNNYEQSLKKAIADLKAQGVTAGVFGDIYLESHRQWIERVCAEMEICPVFPLWGMNTEKLISDFVADGFATLVVSVRKEKLPKEFLGRIIDDAFLNDLRAIEGTDLCGENGEYHTFVFDGPVFNHRVSFEKGDTTEDDKHWFLELK